MQSTNSCSSHSLINFLINFTEMFFLCHDKFKQVSENWQRRWNIFVKYFIEVNLKFRSSNTYQARRLSFDTNSCTCTWSTNKSPEQRGQGITESSESDKAILKISNCENVSKVTSETIEYKEYFIIRGMNIVLIQSDNVLDSIRFWLGEDLKVSRGQVHLIMKLWFIYIDIKVLYTFAKLLIITQCCPNSSKIYVAVCCRHR